MEVNFSDDFLEFIKVDKVDSSSDKITPEQINYYNAIVRDLIQFKIDNFDPRTMEIEEFINEKVQQLYDVHLLPYKWVKRYEESIEVGEPDYSEPYPYLEKELKHFLGYDV